MKKVIIFFIFICAVTFLKIQAQKLGDVDSLIIQINKANEDTNKVNLLNDLSFSFHHNNPIDGVKYGNQELALAEKLKWKKGIANANNMIGLNYFNLTEYPKALDYYFRALKLFEELGDKNGMASVFNNFGNLYYNQIDYPNSIKFLNKSLKLYEELGDKIGLAWVLNNIGNNYVDLMDYPKALQYHLRALKLFEELGNKSGISSCLGNIGENARLQSDYEKSLVYYFKGLKISREISNINYEANTLSLIGNAYRQIAIDSSKFHLNKLFPGDKTKALQLAKIYTDSSIIKAKEIGNLKILFESYQNLSDIQALLGENKNALESYKIYSITKDSIFNIEKNKKLTQSAMQYEFDKKEALTKAEQDKKDIKQRVILISTLLGFLSMIFFSIVFYIQRNNVKKEKKRSEDLLLNILPQEVADEIKLTGSAVAKHYNDVTVLFTDFVNFTGLSQQLSPTQLVAEIHKNFTAFDDIIEKNGLEKIKTIGDAYMAVCGLPNLTFDHATRVVKAALEIRDYIAQNNGLFQIRIGINSGEVVAGIVGVKKFAYDIWGDTVNTASRMEANSETGKINISGSTYLLVKNEFNCEYRGKISAKGKGEVDMYFITD